MGTPSRSARSLAGVRSPISCPLKITARAHSQTAPRTTHAEITRRQEAVKADSLRITLDETIDMRAIDAGAGQVLVVVCARATTRYAARCVRAWTRKVAMLSSRGISEKPIRVAGTKAFAGQSAEG